MSTTSAATAAPRATGYERPLDLYSRLSNSIARYGRSIEVEADERLYVRPLLETDDLLLLHACHCHEVMTRGGLVTQAKLAELFGVSQQRISMIEKRCKKAGALDEDGRVTATVGRVGVSVVQYCHHEWVDNHFGELVVAADDRGEMRLKHADRATLQPRLYSLVSKSIRDLHARVGERAELALTLVGVGQSARRGRTKVRAGDVAASMNVPLRTMQERIRAMRELGWLSYSGIALSEAGVQVLNSTQLVLYTWTRETTDAMTTWVTDGDR